MRPVGASGNLDGPVPALLVAFTMNVYVTPAGARPLSVIVQQGTFKLVIAGRAPPALALCQWSLPVHRGAGATRCTGAGRCYRQGPGDPGDLRVTHQVHRHRDVGRGPRHGCSNSAAGVTGRCIPVPSHHHGGLGVRCSSRTHCQWSLHGNPGGCIAHMMMLGIWTGLGQGQYKVLYQRARSSSSSWGRVPCQWASGYAIFQSSQVPGKKREVLEISSQQT